MFNKLYNLQLKMIKFISLKLFICRSNGMTNHACSISRRARQAVLNTYIPILPSPPPENITWNIASTTSEHLIYKSNHPLFTHCYCCSYYRPRARYCYCTHALNVIVHYYSLFIVHYTDLMRYWHYFLYITPVSIIRSLALSYV